MGQERPLERRIVTVLFADLVGFTALSERLDPEDLATVQDAYFGAVGGTLERYGGRLEKYIGDAAVAVFGVPRARDDDAERAVRAGLALVAAVERVGAALGVEGLAVRVGVNTGEVVYAERGPERGPVTGDTVNVAARLQAAAAPGTVLVGEATTLAVAAAVELGAVAPFPLEGKAVPVRARRALAALSEPSRERAMGALRAPLLGRARELGALADALARVRATGRGERWLIVAPPGVGKTRLLAEFAARARQRGHAVLRGRSRPDAAGPYEPLAQLLVDGLAHAGHDVIAGDGAPQRAASMLRRLLSSRGVAPERVEDVVASMIGIVWPAATPAGGLTEDIARRRDRLFGAWLEAIEALVGGGALLLAEDMHWASADFLAFLKAAAGVSFLVAATARPALLERAAAFAAELEDGRARTLHLPTLPPADAAALVRALAGDALTDALVARLVERSDGNALFIEELLRSWVSAGTLVRDGERWRLASHPEKVVVPATVQAIYAAQLDDLAPDARAAARRASVAGRRFPGAALQALGVEHPTAALASLLARALVEGPLPDAFLGDGYAYRHALLRDAAYATLARADRARLHVRLARWLEEHRPGLARGAEFVAAQYEAALANVPGLARRAGDELHRDDLVRLAADWLERAADAAVASAAPDRARDLYRRALELTPSAASLDRARRLLRLGEVTAFGGEMDAGARLLEESLALCRDRFRVAAEEAERRAARTGYARAAERLGAVWNQQLRFADAARLADETLAEIGEARDAEAALLKAARATNRAHATTVVTPVDRRDAAEAVAIARELRDEALEVRALWAAVAVWAEAGEPVDEVARLVRLCRSLRDWERLVSALRVQALDLMTREPDRARALLEEGASVSETNRLPAERVWVRYSQAELDFCVGAWDAAWDAALGALEASERGGQHRVVLRAWFVLVPLAAARGRRDALARAFAWFEARRGSLPHSKYALLMVAAIDLRFAAAGLRSYRPDPARLLPSFEYHDDFPSTLDAMRAVTEAWVSAGLLDAARDAVRRMTPREGETSFASPVAASTLALCRGLIGLAEGRVDEAASFARTAFREASRLPAPWWMAQALALLARGGRASSSERAELDRLGRALGLAQAA